ncbi:unnamed protein product [Staurois parvus]|uniref:Uncharacterized protein n=1 Tax=Staurois parvus TaxID=386267 RepID=A0ABN9FJM7_9NEOB|nr:unnamed protein product [Staurois parvus]
MTAQMHSTAPKGTGALIISVAPSVPPVSAHQRHLSVPINATCQCPSTPPVSAHLNCLIVPPISASQCHLTVLTFSAHQ